MHTMALLEQLNISWTTILLGTYLPPKFLAIIPSHRYDDYC